MGLGLHLNGDLLTILYYCFDCCQKDSFLRLVALQEQSLVKFDRQPATAPTQDTRVVHHISIWKSLWIV